MSESNEQAEEVRVTDSLLTDIKVTDRGQWPLWRTTCERDEHC